ncbi:hypothetical protein [Mycoplasma ovis]|uniref:hypothetical protein n=1 Tax=Mycoplasma ovis TaxID=171632 RepID=UPI00041B56C1|nr:hypothetical protein [Mycoplasma ovis]
MAIFFPLELANLTISSILPKFEAKKVIMILPLAEEIIFFSSWIIVNSLSLNPGCAAAVDSHSSKSTSLEPILISLWNALLLILFFKSNLKSPLKTMYPLGVEIEKPKESGIEWLTSKKSIPKYFVKNKEEAL